MKQEIKILFRTCSIVIGVIFIFVGLFRNEHIAVLNKAVVICLECIGIG